MTQTIRETVSLKLKEVGDIEAIGAHRAAALLVELSSLLANVSRECVDRKIWYAQKKMMLLKEYTKSNQATIAAEASSEYKDFLEAEELRKVVIEAIRSLKYYLRVNEQEMKDARY